jgi:predicted Zn-dependent protease
VAAQPDSAPAWYAFFDLSLKLGKADDARDALRRYAALEPGDRTALFHRGELAAMLGVDLAESEVALREYIKGPILLGQTVVDVAWWRLGQVLQKEGKVAEAREAYAKAIAIDGRDRDCKESLRRLDAASAPRR